MSLVDWRSLPVRVKRSRKRLYGVLADEYNLVTWMELPIEIKRSKKKLYDFIANELNISSFDELPVECRRSTRLMYGFIQENGGGGGTTDTLTVVVTDGADPITGATVTVDGDSETTGSDGEATFTLEYGDYSATIRASGYTTKTENIAFRSNHKNFTIALEQSGGTGTVTVTGVYGDNQPLTELTDVLLYTGDGVPTIEDDSRFVAIGGDDDNVVTLVLWDTTAHEPTQDTAIPFGTYNIYAEGTDEEMNLYNYNGTLTVDGDETVTITLTQE